MSLDAHFQPTPFSGLIEAIEHDWHAVARPEQRLPPGEWIYWLLLAGRGYGKSRTGAETVREWVKQGFNYVNLIGPTSDDIRSIMIEGESGILNICPNSERPRYLTNSRELQWPNGAVSLVFSAEEPDRARGKQSMKIWADELAAWRYPDAWDQAILGLRLGAKPQAIITTTPRPTKLIRTLVNDPRTHLTRGSTYDNRLNLADAFVEQIIKRFEGTRAGRQELNAELLDQMEGALWNRDMIDATRRPAEHAHMIEFERIVVAIDPAISVSETSDETGIVTSALGYDGRGYVLEDLSGKFSPTEWATRAIAAYRRWGADRIIAESNQGGAMVENTLRTVDRNVPVRLVHAKRGKFLRAEPVSSLYEQGRVSHVGVFTELEDQMTSFAQGSTDSPDRLDALVYALSDLMVTPQTASFVFA